MTNESSEPVKISFTPEFKRNLRTLAKKYPHIRSDVQPVIEQIQSGNFVGDQIPRTGYTIFKGNCSGSERTRAKGPLWAVRVILRRTVVRQERLSSYLQGKSTE